MATITETEDGQIRELSRAEGVALLERQTRRVLGMSAKEFIEAWESGALDDHPNHGGTGDRSGTFTTALER